MLTFLQQGIITLVRFDRNVDMLHANYIQDVLMSLVERPAPHVVLDLRAMHVVDSAGVATFLMAVRRASRNEGRLAFVVGDSHALRIFQLTGVDRIFEIFSTVEGAFAALLDGAPPLPI